MSESTYELTLELEADPEDVRLYGLEAGSPLLLDLLADPKRFRVTKITGKKEEDP